MEKCDFCKYDAPLTRRSEVCSACVGYNKFQVKEKMSPVAAYQYEKLKKFEEGINDKNIEFDRDTALMVLKDLSALMYPSHDLFGNRTLVIDRYKFELIRRKYLDQKK